jgi:hypothetical protein
LQNRSITINMALVGQLEDRLMIDSSPVRRLLVSALLSGLGHPRRILAASATADPRAEVEAALLAALGTPTADLPARHRDDVVIGIRGCGPAGL